MHEVLILKIIKKKLTEIFGRLRDKFSNEKSINWTDELAFYETNVDCAVGIALSFKHLENEEDEGIQLYVHINKVPAIETVIKIDVYLIRSNGTAFEMDEVAMDLQKNKEVKTEHLEQVFKLLERYFNEMSRLIKDEYLTRHPKRV